jgi:hypothetical protein
VYGVWYGRYKLAKDYAVPRELYRFSTEDLFTVGNKHAGALPATKHGVRRMLTLSCQVCVSYML